MGSDRYVGQGQPVRPPLRHAGGGVADAGRAHVPAPARPRGARRRPAPSLDPVASALLAGFRITSEDLALIRALHARRGAEPRLDLAGLSARLSRRGAGARAAAALSGARPAAAADAARRGSVRARRSRGHAAVRRHRRARSRPRTSRRNGSPTCSGTSSEPRRDPGPLPAQVEAVLGHIRRGLADAFGETSHPAEVTGETLRQKLAMLLDPALLDPAMEVLDPRTRSPPPPGGASSSIGTSRGSSPIPRPPRPACSALLRRPAAAPPLRRPGRVRGRRARAVPSTLRVHAPHPSLAGPNLSRRRLDARRAVRRDRRRDATPPPNVCARHALARAHDRRSRRRRRPPPPRREPAGGTLAREHPSRARAPAAAAADAAAARRGHADAERHARPHRRRHRAAARRACCGRASGPASRCCGDFLALLGTGPDRRVLRERGPDAASRPSCASIPSSTFSWAGAAARGRRARPRVQRRGGRVTCCRAARAPHTFYVQTDGAVRLTPQDRRRRARADRPARRRGHGGRARVGAGRAGPAPALRDPPRVPEPGRAGHAVAAVRDGPRRQAAGARRRTCIPPTGCRRSRPSSRATGGCTRPRSS